MGGTSCKQTKITSSDRRLCSQGDVPGGTGRVSGALECGAEGSLSSPSSSDPASGIPLLVRILSCRDT